MRSLVELWFDQRIFVPTPLFAEFYTEAVPRGHGKYAGLLYESVTARFGADDISLSMTVRPTRDGETHVMTVAEEKGDVDSEECFTAELAVNSRDPLTFRQRLRSAVLHVRGPVVLRTGSQVELSDVEIQASRLNIQTGVLSIRSYKQGEAVNIQLEHPVEHLPNLRVDVKPGASLAVSWPGAEQYPWSEFVDHGIFEESRDTIGAMLALRRILVWFKKDKKDTFAKFRDHIDNVVVGDKEVRREMLAFLMEKRVIRLNGEFYTLVPEEAHKAGINWVALRSPIPSGKILNLINEFLASSAS